MGVMYYRDAAGNIHPVNKGPKGDKGDKGDAGLSGGLDILTDVSAPGSTPSGKFLGTVAQGSWGPVDLPDSGVTLEDGDARWVNLDGDTMTGTLVAEDVNVNYLASKYGADVGGYQITSVADPASATDAANQRYVDAGDAASWTRWSGTQAQFNALVPPLDPNTLYVIVP